MPTESSSSPVDAVTPAISQEDPTDLGLGEFSEHDLGKTLHLLVSQSPDPPLVPGVGEVPINVSELCDLMNNASGAQILNDLRRAACRGLTPDAYHPDQGQPASFALARCNGCLTRIACLALALRAEDPEERCGWYGGLGPSDRDALAATLGTGAPEPVLETECSRAAVLRSQGWTINAIAEELHCSRRTVQRYLKRSAA